MRSIGRGMIYHACGLSMLAALFAYAGGAGPATRAPPRAVDRIYEVPRLNMTLIRIEAGEFTMGSPAEEVGRQENELQHPVRLTKPFYIGATEVSQAQYKALTGENPSHFKGDDLPVENVSWHAAALFCELLSKREGRTFRLPGEAEWEYAARAGRQGPVSGPGKLGDMAWHADNSGKQPLDSATLWDTDQDNYFARLADNDCCTRIVGAGTPNAWGVHDMQGNVAEWVADWFAKDYFAASPAADPTGPLASPLESRVIRGGSWGSDPRHCRVACRDWDAPADHSPSRGFRVVMEP